MKVCRVFFGNCVSWARFSAIRHNRREIWLDGSWEQLDWPRGCSAGSLVGSLKDQHSPILSILCSLHLRMASYCRTIVTVCFFFILTHLYRVCSGLLQLTTIAGQFLVFLALLDLLKAFFIPSKDLTAQYSFPGALMLPVVCREVCSHHGDDEQL